jgi:hypothetical protein
MNRHYSARVAVAASLGFLCGAPAQAEFIRNNFGLTNPARTITFEEHFLPKYTRVTDQYGDLGVIFEPAVFYNSVLTHLPNNNDELEVQLTMASNITVGIVINPFSIRFTEPQQAAAFILESNTGTVEFTALNEGRVLETGVAEIGKGVSLFENFFGFKDIVFDEIRVRQTESLIGSPGVVFDRIEMLPAAVPEPNVLVLLVAALLSVALAAARRMPGRATVIFAAAGWMIVTAEATAGPYAFTKIAETGTELQSALPRVALNNKGEVAFVLHPAGGGSVLLLSSGSTTTTIADTRNSDFITLSAPVLNDLGQVVFDAALQSAGGGIFRSENGRHDIIVQTDHRSSIHSATFPSLNNRGEVAFQGWFRDRLAQGLFLGSGGPVETLFETTARFGGPEVAPSLNDAGHIAFQVRGDDAIRKILLYREGMVTTVAQPSSGAPFLSVERREPPELNARDEVAFLARIDQEFNEGLFLASGDMHQKVVDTTGPFSVLGSFDLNDNGVVAFDAAVGSGNEAQWGIFTGGDPITDRVIGVGDLLDGSAITGLGLGGINNHGQIAFSANLQDGRFVIFRAEPVAIPEPATIVLLTLGATALRHAVCRPRSIRQLYFASEATGVVS